MAKRPCPVPAAARATSTAPEASAMDLKQLRAFVSIAETGSVTRAAARMNLVQPAVTRQLQLLEEDLNTALFVRSRGGMVLTDAGHTLMGYARRVFDDLERARTEVHPAGGPVKGTVNVGLLASTSELLSTRLVAAVAERHPDIRLRLNVGYAGHLFRWLEAGDIDLALTYAEREPAAVQVRTLLTEALWAVAPAGTRLREDRGIALSKVASERFVMPAAPQGLRSIIEHAAASQGLELRVSVETNDLTSQKALVKDGWGWTILPAVGVSGEVQRGELSAAPVIRPTLRRRIVLAVAANRQAAAAVRCVTDRLLECAKDAVVAGNWTTAEWLGD